MKFHQDRTSDKKVVAFDNSCFKAVLPAWPTPSPKRCDRQLFLAALGQVIRCSKALDLGSFNMQFQHDWPKDKKITAFLIFLPENLEKYRSTEHYGAALEIDNFSLSQLLIWAERQWKVVHYLS